MKGKRILRLALALILVSALLPTTAFSAAGPLQKGADPQEISAWSDLETALQNDGSYKLTADVTPDDPFWADALVVPSGVTVTLDLNGHMVDRGYTKAGWDGSVLRIEGGTLTLIDSDPDADHGGAVAYTDPVTGRTIPVAGGILTGGYPQQYGGAVSINGGTFKLEGGSIACNGVGNNGFGAEEALGGGVYLQKGAFHMSGGAVVGNRAVNTSFGVTQGRGGGVYIAGGTFTLSGGTIRGNTAGRQGGGVSVGMSGTFLMTGGVIVGNSAPVENSVYTIEGGTVPDLVRITLNANYGDEDTAEQAVLKNVNSPLAVGVFIRDGYDFKHWSTGVNGSGTIFADGGDITADAPVTLYARWEEITYTVVCTADPETGGTLRAADTENFSNPQVQISVPANDTVTLFPAAKDGYTLASLSYQPENGTEISLGINDPPYTFSMPAVNVIAKASFTPREYTVTYELDGGMGDTSQTYTIESTDTLLEPIKADHSFGGWKVTAADGNWTTDEILAAGTALTGQYGNVTLTAQWTLNTYTVAVTPGEHMIKTADSGNASQTVNAGSAIADVVYEASENYYFPEDYSVASANGIAVTRMDWTHLKVSGTPTDNAAFTLAAPTKKTQGQTPAAIFTAVGRDSGTLSNTAAGMRYKIDDGDWQTITGSSVDLTGLAPCTITVMQPGNGTTTVDSDVQTITVTKAAAPTLEATQPATIRDKGLIPTTAAHQKSRNGTDWENCDGPWTDLGEGTYYVRVKAAGGVLASDAQEIPLAVAKYTITFADEDGTELQSSEFACGETPVYNGETPTKPATDEHTYTFYGWTPEITPVTGAGTYTATYESKVNEYTVTFETNGGSDMEPVKVPYGESVTEPDTPKKTSFAFAGWFADEGLETPCDFTAKITSDTTIYAKWMPVSYPVFSGEDPVWTQGSGEDVVITVKRSDADETCFDHFAGVEIDGNPLENGVDYTAARGSAVITLKASALQTLSVGEHTVTVNFDDGKTAITLTVKAAPAHTDPIPPQTGDGGHPGLWIALMILSGLWIAVLSSPHTHHVSAGRR